MRRALLWILIPLMSLALALALFVTRPWSNFSLLVSGQDLYWHPGGNNA